MPSRVTFEMTVAELVVLLALIAVVFYSMGKGVDPVVLLKAMIDALSAIL